MALVLPFHGVRPQIHPSAFLAPTAVLIGNVRVEAESSIWFGAVLRGDHPEHPIVIGPRTSIQDQCVVHVGDWAPTVVGRDVTVGHGAVFESCTIGDETVIGMNAVILQNARIGNRCVVAAGSVVKQGFEVPDRTLVAGVPASVKKVLEGRSESWVEGGGEHYVALSRDYLRQGLDSMPGGEGD
ncbi:MAG: gamma carbonic anhydrase family protein [Gemmatimonadota bacterium]|jgi:carbonic anhydrase/acetyltransferase-like protein (isoleucine patch superfamily)